MSEDNKRIYEVLIESAIGAAPDWLKPIINWLKPIIKRYVSIFIKIIMLFLLSILFPLVTALSLNFVEIISNDNKAKRMYVEYVQSAFNLQEKIDESIKNDKIKNDKSFDDKIKIIKDENYERLDYFQIFSFDLNFNGNEQRNFPFRLKQNQKAEIKITNIQATATANKKCSAPEAGNILKVKLVDPDILIFSCYLKINKCNKNFNQDWWKKTTLTVNDDEIVSLLVTTLDTDLSKKISKECQDSIKVSVDGSITVYKEIF